MGLGNTWMLEPFVKARMLLQSTLDVRDHLEQVEEQAAQDVDLRIRDSLRSREASRAYARIFETEDRPERVPYAPGQRRQRTEQAGSSARSRSIAWILAAAARVVEPIVLAGQPKGRHERGWWQISGPPS